MAYSTVLFDLDHTLFDFDSAEDLAFDHALRSIGLTDPASVRPLYDRINRALWDAVERHEIAPPVVRNARFEQLLAALELDADAVGLADRFAAGLAAFGDLYPGARDLLDLVAGSARLGLVTNGLREVQRPRIERLGIGHYFEVIVVSAEVGVSKPSPAIFELALDGLGHPLREATVMVGDSISSDIRGAHAAGLATCWYNPMRAARPDWPPIDHEVHGLADVGTLVGDP